MTDLFAKNKEGLSVEDYIFRQSMVFLGMKGKVKEDAKFRTDENKQAIKDFTGRLPFLFCWATGGDGFVLGSDLNKVQMQKKVLLIIKAIDGTQEEPFPNGHENDIVFMEFTKPILENMYNVCTEVFLPVLGNPVNQIGWSDLVSKDLMEKFQSFLAYTYVTIGQTKGRCLLPLPSSEVTQNEKTLSKDKSQVLETAIIHWTKQIKNVLKQDPEDALKKGNNPGPLTECEFWNKQAQNLNSICDQLNSERIKKVLKWLEQNKSTFITPFAKLQKDVQIARVEANDNAKYLKTLTNLFQDLQSGTLELSEVSELFIPILHTILMIWTYSTHYNTPARLVVLIREISNEIIRQCCQFVTGPSIFENLNESPPNPQPAFTKLATALDVCAKFKEVYFDYKHRSKNAWKITSNALFVRFDAFSERCQDIMQMTQTIMQFMKLEKIDIGNTKGNSLTIAVKQIWDEFQQAQSKFCSVNYDIMDIEKREFDDDFFEFRQSIKELDRRVSAVLTQAFDDCDTIVGKFKLLESFEGLLSRPIILDELERKQIVLIELYKNDLKKVNQIFNEGRELINSQDENSPITKNMSPVAGALNWTNGLRGRITEPMEKLLTYNQSMQDREEFKDACKLYQSLQTNMSAYEDQNVERWNIRVEENTDEKLNKFLLYREETALASEGFLRVNFAEELVEILREVKYLQLLDFPIPATAQKLFEKVNTYRLQTLRLTIISDTYNNILATLLPVEKPLLQTRIAKMGQSLQDGIDRLRWNSEGIDKFIKGADAIVMEVDELVKKMKENIKKIHKFMNFWTEKPFYERKPKPMPPDELAQQHSATIENRLEDVRNHGKEIHKLLKDTEAQIKPDKKSKEWISYVEYVNGLLIEGITMGISSSMKFVANNINIQNQALSDKQPIFDLKILLQNREVQFEPSIESNERGNGIRDIINNIVQDFISLSVQMPRLDTGQGDYLVEIKDQFELYGATQKICIQLDEIEKASQEFIQQYSGFAFLWTEELEVSFQAFLETGDDIRDKFEQALALKIPDMEEVEITVERENFNAMVTKIYEGGVAMKQPSLDKFDEKINHLSEVKRQIKAMQENNNVGWLKVDSSPIKIELTQTVQRWIDRFTSFLMTNTLKKLNNIKSWTKEVNDGISNLPTKDMEKFKRSEKDKNLLQIVMTHLRDVKQIKEKTDEQFGPIRATIQMLKKHSDDFEMDPTKDYVVECENSKTFLNETSIKALGPVKESILPLQKSEAENVKERRERFILKVKTYRKDFMEALPYHIQQSSPDTINHAYKLISEYYEKTNVIKAEQNQLANQETLFDLERKMYKDLKDCNNELISLKKMWDLVALIDLQFESWRKTLWDQIDTDLLMTLIKDMQGKQCSATQPSNKDIKNYRAFTGLNERVKNMNTILPLIASLHSPYMLDRHWKKMQKICVQEINFKSPSFCLADLIQLELFKYAEEVTELVEGAQKEDKISKKLNGIKAIWETQNFVFEVKEDGPPLLTALDEISEFVDTHSMDLMTMQSSKDVEEFKDEVIKWVKTLKTVDSVITKWVKVQKDWQKLNPIFMQSEDIRTQLQDETKRFEKADADWQNLMRDAMEEPKVTDCACFEGREEFLKELQNEITYCEKALNDYLEQKKKMFPRFYFVSNQSLLEILSNGNNPRKVNEYLADCFDGMKLIDLLPQDMLDKRPMQAKGMFSKEMEYVPFKENFVCSGPVEGYLSNLEAKMMSVLAEVLINAKNTADDWAVDVEKPREKWLEDYCAQLALLTTQIIWTEETSRVFEDLESGSEGAMKENLALLIARINKLIERVRTDLTPEIRIKIITIITIDVHSRDVIELFYEQKIVSAEHFKWQSQLKFYLEHKDIKKDPQKKCVSRICDWTTWYNYEYVGNTGRLVITPLTDRCYITLTQALNLSMGGAPAGPAGTGKTETTKDLGRALGLQVVVFNCSPQMTYLTMATIFMGLSQSGAWGCFDEFNRIEISVLSVVSTQVKYCLDAVKVLKADPSKVLFKFGDEDEIPLKLTAGFFITMNPGYAGRTELPENLKALFRSCAMVVPDIVLICENMLLSEGFAEARNLSKKFMTLYTLAFSLLSKQRHYDWGLRAVKSVLRQAGFLKRMSPNDPETLILMRALRDFNTPKIVIDDIPIFMGLIADLFPGCNPPVEFDLKVKDACETCARDPTVCATPGQPHMNIRGEEKFIEKCVELSDLLNVRHSVFIIGFPGSAKSTIWKLLARALTLLGRETIFDIVDPKCVSTDELFGFMNPKTKEWRDGVLSTMMRNMSKCQDRYKEKHAQKWVILDGDVDPMWIESCNTVMDDNKMLTLVSQERIPLTPSMRLILEVAHLKFATPATVSRGGVLFINEFDVGWRPYYESWMSKFKAKNDEAATTTFTLNLSHYCDDSFIDDIKRRPTIAPMCLMAYFQSLTTIIDFMYDELKTEKVYSEFIKKLKDGSDPEISKLGTFDEAIKLIYEGIFVFAMIWSFGAPQTEERTSFSNGLKSKSAKIRFPEASNQVYDYKFNILTLSWELWANNIEGMDPNYDGLFNNLIVPTTETKRQIRLIDIHRTSARGIFYGGIAGTGKTTIIKNYIAKMNKDELVTAAVNFNSYTDSRALQGVLQANVGKLVGRTFGPPVGKKLLFFIDDINMPTVDTYGTQQPIALIRQIIDYGIIFDRAALSEQILLKDIMFAACMNPKSGSFYVDLRLQRHFTTVALMLPEKEILRTIYEQILRNHFNNFDSVCKDYVPKLIAATTTVFNSITMDAQFFPTATKFHYQFNLRDFAKIVQNIMLATPVVYKGNALGLCRLWLHECHRVWRDRLIRKEDNDKYRGFIETAIKNDFAGIPFKVDDIHAEPLVFTSFVSACKGHDASYMQVASMEDLNSVLEEKLAEYNEQVSAMDLVLFNQAMEHITRIARIIDQPCGNALLVGVGGSGKQSLSKLTSFILNYEVFRIVVATGYGVNELKADIQNVFKMSGVQGRQVLFIMTDSQIVNEKFLVSINDILSSGYVPELFAEDERDEIRGKVRAEAKSNGVQDMPEDLWNFYLDKVRKNMHMGLCFSPVSDKFRIRARMFPGLINCTSIDWFHEWPEDALIGVANRFLKEVELPTDELRENIAKHMAFVHISISEANKEFKKVERRHNYTTPTSFLELINFYKMLLSQKQGVITDQIARLEIGLGIMETTTLKVDNLKSFLEQTQKVVNIEKEKTQILIDEVEEETAKANIEEEAAAIKAAETKVIKDAADAQKAFVDDKLAAAIPAMERARAAVDGLSTKAIGEFKGMATPPTGCDQVTKAVLILRKEYKKHDWGTAQLMMKDPNKFKQQLEAYDKDNIDDRALNDLKPILALDFFNGVAMEKKSSAAANLCKWVIAIVEYNEIFRNVKPLQDAAQAAGDLASAKGAELKIVLDALEVVRARVRALNEKLDGAKAKLKEVEDQASGLMVQLNLAQRLVNGLVDEKVRWAANVVTFKEEKLTMIGNALVSAAFVSYIGPFLYTFRDKLWREQWIPDMTSKKIPTTSGVDPLLVLSSKSMHAVWAQQELPADRVSLENAAIIVSCSRYPLIIDPQLQGIRWVKGKEGTAMQIIQLSQDKWIKRVELAISTGQVLMIEAIGQDIDAILDPLLSRAFIKRGKNQFVKLGAEEVEIAQGFKLYLQTKLINPHYKPETAAQCTIINFLVTEKGLEDQLLASVVRVEKPELEQEKEQLTSKQNQFMITLAQLEKDLLQKLSDADPNTILENTPLIESLEQTKLTSMQIQKQQAAALISEENINKLREVYRMVATEGAMLYFLLITLCIVNHMYQYSLEAFQAFFFKAIDKTPKDDDEIARGFALRQQIRVQIYQWVSRGLFERHKQIFMAQLTFRLMQKKIIPIEYSQNQMDFLINCPVKIDPSQPNTQKKWLSEPSWGSVLKLVEIEGFEQIGNAIGKEASKRFEDWYNEDRPEEVPLPGDYRSLEQEYFKKLLVVRTLRPDRMTTALTKFVATALPNGTAFTECDSSLSAVQVLDSAYSDSSTTTPIYFILSPGANPIKDVEELCKVHAINPKTHFHLVALGQGQEENAYSKLEMGHKEGHWVMLQNVHLMPYFLKGLEDKLAKYAALGSNSSFRLFLTSDPSEEIPIGLLERCIKLTNEPPAGMKANLLRAFTFFQPADFDEKDSKLKTILFGLSYFHAVMVERRKFGPKGWNMHYNFSIGDLRDSALVCQNYLERSAASSGKVPWEDLRYIFGDIMYGGYITDDIDRCFCSTFLFNLMNDTLFEEAELFPFIEGKANISFKCAQGLAHDKYVEYIRDELPPETPLAFGMHPNAEIDFRTTQCRALFEQLVELTPKGAGSTDENAPTPLSRFMEFEDRCSNELNLESNRPNIEDIRSKLGDDQDEMKPYQNVFLQECEVIGVLIDAVMKSVGEIQLANKGELTMSEQMEALMTNIFLNKVPPQWMELSYESTRGLSSWLSNMKQRLDQLNAWKDDPVKIPTVTWLNRLKNPQSFLTAIKQVYARKNILELNKLYIQTDILKKWYWEELPALREGAYIFGMQVEGARWDFNGSLEESEPKKQFSVIPVVNCKAQETTKIKSNDITTYQCPVYLTNTRGKSYVFHAQLRTKQHPNKWILAGVAVILDVEGVSDTFNWGKNPNDV